MATGDDIKLPLTSRDVSAERLEQFRELFPEVTTEGKFDLKKLAQLLGEAATDAPERYGLSWAGKSDAIRTIQTTSPGTLLPAPVESVNFDTTENLIIEGDNLETLKLLQGGYHGRVKMIYIDPPYNTGNEFIYPDNFKEGLADYLKFSGQVSGEGIRLTTNAETDGRYHSKWLTMMYPRLFLARNLLREDGVIFISVDDIEAANVVKLCQEIFGEENMLPTIIRRAKIGGGSDNKHIAKEADYVIAAAKNAEVLPKFYIPHTEKDLRRYSQQDAKGKFFWDTYSRSGLASEDPESDSLYYEVKFPDGSKRAERWRRSEERLVIDLKTGEAKFIKTSSGFTIHFKQRLNEEGKRPRQILFDSMGNTEGGADLEKVWPEMNFSYPKPCALISLLAEISGSERQIVMDFFAGSGTTAQAVLELNAQDGGNRKFILVQLPEPTGRKDFPTIADITKERVRRVIKKLSAAEVEKQEAAASQLKLGGTVPVRELDLGFKVFKLGSSNFKVWDAAAAPKEDAPLAEQLKLMAHNVEADRTDEALLYELVLKSNLPLTTKITACLAGKQPFYEVADGALVICLARKISQEILRGLMSRNPKGIICLDIAFAGNDQLKTNTVLEMKSHGIEFHTA